MSLRNILLFLAASHGRVASNDTNDRDPEVGLKISPGDTLDIDHDEADYADEQTTEDPFDPNNSRQRRRLSSATAFTSFSRSLTLVDTPTWFQTVKTFVFPPKENIDSFIPNYRHTPIVSGLLVPFSILLEIPAVTEHWYIRTENNQVIESRANPKILDVGLGISLGCAVLANLCLIARFLEQRVKTMTILCTIFLSIHDIINIVAVTVFGVQHRFSDGFTYGQSFWMTVCSTAASTITNATLIWDLYRTPDFNKSGSGLTRKQRTLVIIIMALFCYICFGALINSLLIKLSFIDGLYFTLVSIETIGFGDIVPITTGSRVFICAYSAIGFLNLGVAIVMCRETVLELMEVEYKKRAQKVKERWKEAREIRRVEHRWRHAIEWRLKEMGMPVWVRDENWHGHRVGGGGRSVRRVATMDQSSTTGSSHNTHGPTGMRLNLNALTQAQLEASATEAGVPLNTLLPPDFIPAAEEIVVHDEDTDKPSTASAWIHHPLASHFEHAFHPTQARTLTHARLGGMAALLTRFAVAVIHIHATEPDKLNESAPSNQNLDLSSEAVVVGETPNNLQIDPSPTIEVDKDLQHLDSDSMPPHPTDNLDLQMMQDLDTMTFYTKLIIAFGLFFVFWTIGSAIFMATEDWSYGISMYFCFVAFTSIGYGDYHPDTPAGRSIFVVWAILGVGTMTILISVIQEAYNSRYQNAMHIRAFDKAVKRYRERVHHLKPRSGHKGHHHFHLWGHKHKQTDPPPPSQDKVQSVSRPPSVFTLSQTQAADKDKATETHARAQESLHALPGHVLRHAETFHAYIRLFVDDGNILDTQRGSSAKAMASSGMAEVSNTLRKLLDEIAMLGGIGKATKEEILQDPDARHTLFVLSIEKALHNMTTAAKEALDAIQKRDELASPIQQEQMDPNEPALEEGHGASSSSNVQEPAS